MPSVPPQAPVSDGPGERGRSGPREDSSASGAPVPARLAWPPLSYIWAAVLGSVLLLGLLHFVYAVRAVLVLVLFAVLFALVLVYPLNLLARYMPRSLAACITAAIVIGVAVVSVVLLAPFVTSQVQWLIARTPDALGQVVKVAERLTPASFRLPDDWLQALGSEATQLLGRVLPVAFDLIGGIFGVFAVLALAMFLAYDGEAARCALLRLVPTSHEGVVRQFLHRAGTILQRWMIGQLAAMAITGVLTGVGLLLLGIESWLVLATLSFVFEFVPYIGPLAAAIPGIITGLAMSPEMGLWVTLMYGGVQLVESYLLQPLIMKNAIRILPALQLVWQLAIASAFGILGVFVATPLLACVQVAVSFFYVERQLGKPSQTTR